MRKPYLIGLVLLAIWFVWLLYGLKFYRGEQFSTLFLLVAFGTGVFPIYFSFVHLLIGERSKQWISWVGIVATAFVIVPVSIFLLYRFA
ncbi:hypothetical protein ABE137_19000 [Brevibacillus laterosporus]|uniref:Membrane protein n=2 Tax=Brevibacillus TaxID=55080 RepID=A0A0F6XZT3_BRELA|nr:MULTISPECIES: hypothetical protein [Brevibacillus]AKF94326.1 membrane protein [Brevibacillus laterosporus]MCR8983949.1 hypothetical protein [Brevibacillus laterosporus]MCZ0829668.1 hypothetical protein [Brevibacillus halotolerans]GIO03825.1 hypothetical protein J5TS2_44930 [Brevibacillus halotolerans]